MSKLVKKDFDQALVTSIPLKERFEQIGLSEKDFNREVGYAVQICNRIKDIEKVDTASIFESVYNACNAGLTLNPLMNRAYLIPRWDSRLGKTMMQCVPSYSGLSELIIAGNKVTHFDTQLVYEGEKFEAQLGDNPKITHIANPFAKEKKLAGVYSLAYLKDGSFIPELMSVDEINEIRALSDSYKAYEAGKVKSCVWTDFYGEMAKKTVIKRLVKRLPAGNNHDKVSEAINLDNQDFIVRDFDKFGERIIQLADKLCEEKEYKVIRSKLQLGISQSEATDIYEDLIMRLDDDPYSHSINPTQGEISKFVSRVSEK